MQFSKIIGQQTIKNKLIQTVKDNRISHAQLFLGPEGCGKLGLAIAYAQFINCTGRNSESDDSCGVCASCRKYQKLAHPDLHFIYPTSTTKEVPEKPSSKDFIGNWRSLLLDNEGAYIKLIQWYNTIGIENKQGIINVNDCTDIIRTLSYKSYESKYKVVIIWMVEKLFHSAAPKILKILEEPPDNTLILLVAEESGQIISTILSRTQLVKIKPLSNNDISTALINNYGIELSRANMAARNARGNFIDALEYVNSEENDNYFEQFIVWMRLCFNINIENVSAWIGEITKIGREKLKIFLSTAVDILREAMIIKIHGDKFLNYEGDERKFIINFSNTISEEFISEISRELSRASMHIERNANTSILFMDLSLKINKMLKSRARSISKGR